jgi:hypothetical protein
MQQIYAEYQYEMYHTQLLKLTQSSSAIRSHPSQ